MVQPQARACPASLQSSHLYSIPCSPSFEGAAGKTSKSLFNKHSINSIGDESREVREGPRTQKPLLGEDGAQLRAEEADLLIYGSDAPPSEYNKAGSCISPAVHTTDRSLIPRSPTPHLRPHQTC